MTATPEVPQCPNCGAPLELDADGRCRWCEVPVIVPISGTDGGIYDGLTPEQQASIDKVTKHDEARLPESSSYLPLPVYPLLSCLNAAAYDPAIQTFLSTAGRIDAVRALAAAIETAGRRLQDADVSDDEVISRGEKIYLPDELWTFELLTDMFVSLENLDGLERDTRSMLRENVSTHDNMWAKRVRKGLKAAGDGPEQFRSLRSAVPRRH